MLLDEIKQLNLEKLNKLKLYSAVVQKNQRSLDLCFANPEVLSEDIQAQILSFCQDKVKNKFKVNAKFVQDYLDEDVAKSAFMSFIKEEFFFIASKIEVNDVDVKKVDDLFTITVTVTPEFRQMLEQNSFIETVSSYFMSITNFEVKIKFDVVENTLDMDEVMRKTGVMRETQMTKSLFKPQRKIRVEEVVEHIGGKIKDAPKYIVDVTQPEKSVTVCGKIEGIKEIVTPRGMTLFKFDLADFTGQIAVVCFSNDETFLRYKELQVGDEVVINGQVVENTYSQELEFKCYRVSRCKICGDNYEEKLVRPVPEEYAVVMPELMDTYFQQNLFEEKKVPKALQNKTFVVFDFETTGTSYIADKVIELGAVRIQDGKMVDTFSTMVNPERKIPAEISRLTGIVDRMVENAPTFPEIIADFFKFCNGATLVAHNIEFDAGFLKFNTKDSGYIFKHPQIDTLALARKFFKGDHPTIEGAPHNFKLGTIADFLEVRRDNAHRAVDDSIMAADIFIKLIELGAEI